MTLLLAAAGCIVLPFVVRSEEQAWGPVLGISAMHWNSTYITFVDADHGLLLRIASYGWAGSQLLGIAEALGVALYDHRTKRGFGKDVRVGKLVTRPPAN